MTSIPSSPSSCEPATTQYADDEISLIDLAKALVRRWKAMAAIFVAVMRMALVYALLQTPSYTYTSIQVAERGTEVPPQDL